MPYRMSSRLFIPTFITNQYLVKTEQPKNELKEFPPAPNNEPFP